MPSVGIIDKKQVWECACGSTRFQLLMTGHFECHWCGRFITIHEIEDANGVCLADRFTKSIQPNQLTNEKGVNVIYRSEIHGEEIEEAEETD